MADTLKVNPIDCTGHGVCAELLPELVSLDEWGYPIIDPRPVPPALDREARRAVAACPALALKLMRTEHPLVRADAQPTNQDRSSVLAAITTKTDERSA